METLWCAKCKREHGSLELGIIIIRDIETGGQQLHLVNGLDGLHELQDSLGDDVDRYYLEEQMALCQ